MMNDQDAKEFVTKLFALIEKSRTVDDLSKIYESCEIPTKNRVNLDTYSKIEFKITEDEIKQLVDHTILTEDLEFAPNVTSKLQDPLTKILYATAWKNGDLKKIKHIAKGILECQNEKIKQDDALVFHQFGRYLTKIPGEPIIDQHVLRAFGVYSTSDENEIRELLELEIINKKHKELIYKYKNWLISENIHSELKTIEDYSYYIDQLLFAAGKTIKLKKKKRSN